MHRLTSREEDGSVWVENHDYVSAAKRLADYEDAEENETMFRLPCAVGDEVYVIFECGRIPKQLDGTLYGPDGGHGTATGYYCPYEDNCPHDGEFYDCGDFEDILAVFPDIAGHILIDEDGLRVYAENCCVSGVIGCDIFVDKEAAIHALNEKNKTGNKVAGEQAYQEVLMPGT